MQLTISYFAVLYRSIELLEEAGVKVYLRKHSFVALTQY